MHEITLFILLIALVLDWFFGEPEFLWSRLPHPVVFFGKAVSRADKILNNTEDTDPVRYRKGAIAIIVLVGLALVTGLVLKALIGWMGIAGYLLEAFIVFTLLAQKSLYDHVEAVAVGLREKGLEGGQAAVGMIVGRDPELLDKSGVARAGIESLAENFSDGVVAPAFWYAIFGLPGIIIYKMINTADSMIAYRNERYLWFGRVTAQLDDIVNWVPARISALLIAGGAGAANGFSTLVKAMQCAMRDSGMHRSPNAGWPEAAMAGGAGLALGGPRVYTEECVPQSFLNAAGKRDLDADDIKAALKVFTFSCFVLWAGIVLLSLIF